MAKDLALVPAILRPAQAASYLGVCRRQVYNLSEQDPTFPRKIVITSRAVGWRKLDLDAWLAEKSKAA